MNRKVMRLEALLRGFDLPERPPAMAARPAALLGVETRGVDGGRAGAADEEALAVHDVPVAPVHLALACPHPLHAVDHQAGLLARLADGGVLERLTGIDAAA